MRANVEIIGSIFQMHLYPLCYRRHTPIPHCTTSLPHYGSKSPLTSCPVIRAPNARCRLSQTPSHIRQTHAPSLPQASKLHPPYPSPQPTPCPPPMSHSIYACSSIRPSSFRQQQYLAIPSPPFQNEPLHPRPPEPTREITTCVTYSYKGQGKTLFAHLHTRRKGRPSHDRR